LDAALKRIDFQGYDRSAVGKRDYDTDYWAGGGYVVLPGPSAYGAALLGVGLGAILWGRRKTMNAYKSP